MTQPVTRSCSSPFRDGAEFECPVCDKYVGFFGDFPTAAQFNERNSGSTAPEVPAARRPATSAAERVDRILASRWESYAEDMPAILRAMTDENQTDHLIIDRVSDEWPEYVQVTGFPGDAGQHWLHAEIQHPSLAEEGDRALVLPAAVLDAIHADGWQDPVPNYSPNFWIEVPVSDADDLAQKLLRALLSFADAPASLTINCWGPAFDRPR